MSRALKSSVRNLQELYTVVIGIALVKAIEKFSAETGTPAGLSGPGVRAAGMSLVAFVATLVPFYHGAMRHLERTFVEQRGRHVVGVALLVDFVVLFSQAGLLAGMAMNIHSPRETAMWCAILLVLDAMWGVFHQVGLTRQAERLSHTVTWGMLNLVAAAVLIAVLMSRPSAIGGTLVGVALCRTVLDYRLAWGFYFPSTSSESS